MTKLRVGAASAFSTGIMIVVTSTVLLEDRCRRDLAGLALPSYALLARSCSGGALRPE